VFLFCRDSRCLSGPSRSEIGLYPRETLAWFTFDLGPHASHHKVTLNSESQGWIRCHLGLGQRFSRDDSFISVEVYAAHKGLGRSYVHV
jgi:hypothetical protein